MVNGSKSGFPKRDGISLSRNKSSSCALAPTELPASVLSGTIASTATCQLTATYDSPGLVVVEPSGFFEFKNADEFAALWAEYGDPEVAEWDDEEMPRAR